MSELEIYKGMLKKMKDDEIKEILDYFKRNDKNKFGFNQSKILDDKQAKLLLDYITNLQQQVEDVRKQNNDLRQIYQNTYKNYQKQGNDEMARYFMAQIDECRTFYVEPIVDYYELSKKLQQEVDKLNEDKRGMLVELYKANDKRDKLQEENEKLKQADKNTYETSQEIMAELTRENERLKKENEMLEINKVVNIANYVKDMADYKSRCEKAVEIYDDTITYLTTINAEYMDSNTKKTIQDVVNKLEKELDILKGRSDE